MKIFLLFHSFYPPFSFLHCVQALHSIDIHSTIYATKINFIGRSRDKKINLFELLRVRNGNYVSNRRFQQNFENYIQLCN